MARGGQRSTKIGYRNLFNIASESNRFRFIFSVFLQPKKLKSDLILVLVGRWRRNLADIRANGLLI